MRARGNCGNPAAGLFCFDVPEHKAVEQLKRAPKFSLQFLTLLASVLEQLIFSQILTVGWKTANKRIKNSAKVA